MANFITLITLTEKGAAAFKDTHKRAEAFKDSATRVGARVEHQYWCLGGYDGVIIFHAPDDQTAAAILLDLTSQGNVRAKTLRVFDADEIDGILHKV